MHNQNNSSRLGSLLIIGGGEDRKENKEILQKFVAMANSGRPVVVLTAASKVGDEMWTIYDRAFGELGVRNRRPLHISAREEANQKDNIATIDSAGGVFITGGDQKRLLAMIGGSGVHNALLHAYRERGACIAGTSAGASALCVHMIAQGAAEPEPHKGAVKLAEGLRFLRGAVIDQHFSQRQRLPRLLTAVAQNPGLFGVGIDEDTALLIEAGAAAEVIGSGTVTVVDGRNADSDLVDIGTGDCPNLIDMRLHVFPAGSRYRFSTEGNALVYERGSSRMESTSASLLEFFTAVFDAAYEAH